MNKKSKKKEQEKKPLKPVFAAANIVYTGIFFAAFALYMIIMPRSTVSEIEQRELAEFPEFTYEDFLNGKYTNGIANIILGLFGVSPIDFIDGPYAAKLFVLSFYVIWNVMPFKIIVLVGALQSVKKEYYDAAKIDSASRFRMFRKITVPLISPMISYLVITGFIGAFKEYNNAVALFGTDLDSKGMNTIVGYVYNMLYSETGGSPSYASAAAIILFLIVLTITCINLLVSKKKVHY